MQWKRKYRVLVTNANGTALDVSALRCTFNIEKNMDEEPNYSIVTVYNLAIETRNAIIEEGDSVIVEAGYENGAYGLVFNGEIIQWIKGKDDATDSYVRLVCQDSDHLLTSAFVAKTLAAGSTFRDTVNLCSDGYGVGVMDISNNPLPRAKTLFGLNRRYLHGVAASNDAHFYADNGEINIVSSSYSDGEGPDLRPDTGLIGTPQQTEYGVSGQCLLDPRLKLNQMIHIDSEYIVEQEASTGTKITALPTNGAYRVVKLTYEGDTRGDAWYVNFEAVNDAIYETSAKSAMDELTEDALANLRVAIPAIIKEFDPDKQTVTVQVAIREKVAQMLPDGSKANVDKEITELRDVPVAFPRAGGYSLLMPIRKDDECLVIFCDRCIDGWWQNGGVQSQAESRSHDLSDGIALIGPWSQPRKIKGKWPTGGARLMNDSGGCYVEVGNGTVTIAGDCVVTGSLTAGRPGEEGKPGSVHTFEGEIFRAQTKIADLNNEVATNLQSPAVVAISTPKLDINGKEYQGHTHTGVEAGGDTSGGVSEYY